MRVLFVTYHYPPDPAVGAFRPGKVVDAFRAAGHEVVVVTANLPGEKSGLRVDEPGLRVRTVPTWSNPRDWYASIKSAFLRLRGAAVQENVRGISTGPVRATTTLPRWKRWIFSLLWLPDPRQGIVPPVLLASLKERHTGYDLVYSSGPPFSIHLAAWMARLLFRARWMVEFRDPWTSNPWKPWHVRSAFSDGAERWMERRCLAGADRVVCVTEGIRTGFESLNRGTGGKLLVALNGIDHLRNGEPASRRDGPVRVLHVGTLYHNRDPRPFLDALATARERYGMSPENVAVSFVGNCRWFGDCSLEAEIARRGLGDLVTLHDWVPHEEITHMLEEADVLLLLAQNQPDQVPNKLYEYLGTRKVILAWADEPGESAAMLGAVGGHTVISDHPAEEQAEMVARALGLVSGERAEPDGVVLERWRTGNQMATIVSSAESLL